MRYALNKFRRIASVIFFIAVGCELLIELGIQV